MIGRPEAFAWECRSKLNLSPRLCRESLGSKEAESKKRNRFVPQAEVSWSAPSRGTPQIEALRTTALSGMNQFHGALRTTAVPGMPQFRALRRTPLSGMPPSGALRTTALSGAPQFGASLASNDWGTSDETALSGMPQSGALRTTALSGVPQYLGPEFDVVS